jgi:mycoredoxin
MPSSTVQPPAAGTVTMFSTTWCGYCRVLKKALDREGIPFTEVNIEHAPDALAFVVQANNGNQTVPTVLFPDASVATNPSIGEVKSRLAA